MAVPLFLLAGTYSDTYARIWYYNLYQSTRLTFSFTRIFFSFSRKIYINVMQSEWAPLIQLKSVECAMNYAATSAGSNNPSRTKGSSTRNPETMATTTSTKTNSRVGAMSWTKLRNRQDSCPNCWQPCRKRLRRSRRKLYGKKYYPGLNGRSITLK